MILCPIALAVGCRKCAVFSVCPLKTLIGDQATAPAAAPKPSPAKKPPVKGNKSTKRR